MPHVCDRLWQALGYRGLLDQRWPEVDESALAQDAITLVVQVNGKLRDRIEVPAAIGEDDAVALALASEKVASFLDGSEPKKVIARPPKLVNLVV